MTREKREGTVTESGAAPELVEYRRILVPLDGTPFAEVAVRPAAELASRSGGEIRLVSIVGRSPGVAQMVPMSLAPLPAEGIDDVETRVEAVEARLASVAERISRDWNVEASLEVLTKAPTADALLEDAESWSADLIVAATHARGVITRALLGSKAAEMSRGSTCPVLLVPSEDPEPDPVETPLQGRVRRVAVALESEAEADDPVLSNAFTCARLWNAKLVLIHAVPILPAPSVPPGASVPTSVGPGLAADKRAVEAAEGRIEDLVTVLAEHGVETTAEVLQGPRAADTVLAKAEAAEADLLVVGRHDRDVWERLWMGSESDRLQRRIESTALLVCPLEDESD